MITQATALALNASTEVNCATQPQLELLLSEHALALPNRPGVGDAPGDQPIGATLRLW
jgi:hypothetical protein